MQKDVLEKKHAHALNSQYWTAMCLYDKQQFHNAKNLFRDVKKLQKEKWGEKNSDTRKNLTVLEKYFEI